MDAIVLSDITAAGLDGPVSFAIAAGSLSAVIAPMREAADVLTRLILGRAEPESGSVAVLGCYPGAAAPAYLTEFRKRVAVVHPSGGLISNLKVWENLVLPLEYHSALTPAEVEARGLAVLKRLHYQGKLMELPGPLPLYRKRLIGLARAMLIEPDLVVYNGILSGLSEPEQRSLIDTILAFHGEKPGRTSLFVTSNPESIKDIVFEKRIVLQGELSV